MLQVEPGSRGFFARRPRVSLAVALVLGLAMSMALRLAPKPAQELRLTPVVRAVLGDAGSPRIGPAAAEVTVVVFTDYQCPICKTTDPALERLLAADPGVRVIYKDWPVLGEASTQAARVALAADRQGRYAAVHRAFMGSRAKLDAARIEALAVGAGVDWARATAVLAADGPAIDRQLEQHAAQAWSLGMQGTPGYLVGAYLIPGGLDDRQLRLAVKRARRAGPLRAE